MLDDKAPRSKLGPSRGSSFYIENLLGTTYRGVSAGQPVEETPSFRVTTVHSPGICAGTCPGLEAKRPDDSDALSWSGTSPSAHGSSRSECVCPHCVFVCPNKEF